MSDYVLLGHCTCGGEIWASEADCSVAHSLPYCPKFEELEPDKFLAYIREARGLPE
jgi:hypothetical protein